MEKNIRKQRMSLLHKTPRYPDRTSFSFCYTRIECFKKSFTTLRAYRNLFEGHVQCFNCHNVAKHTEFYLGLLRFNVTLTGNAGYFQ
jgi:hypothetical protein